MHRYVIVDAFTDVPLKGNPVAVFLDGSGLSAEVMQRAARELNLSETVFVLAPEEGIDADARARIFTPTSELPFAGHPVLGTAFVLAEGIGETLVRLQTDAGVVPISLLQGGGYGEMEQPLPTREQFDRGGDLLRALGVERSELPIEAYRNGPLHVYVALGSEATVAALSPDMAALEMLGPFGVSCCARVDEQKFKTRMFAPGLGVCEDPATGSAAGPLAVHLARNGWIPFGQEIEIRQGAELARPSVLRARADGSSERLERVVVGGSAVLVARGQYRLA